MDTNKPTPKISPTQDALKSRHITSFHRFSTLKDVRRVNNDVSSVRIRFKDDFGKHVTIKVNLDCFYLDCNYACIVQPSRLLAIPRESIIFIKVTQYLFIQ